MSCWNPSISFDVFYLKTAVATPRTYSCPKKAGIAYYIHHQLTKLISPPCIVNHHSPACCGRCFRYPGPTLGSPPVAPPRSRTGGIAAALSRCGHWWSTGLAVPNLATTETGHGAWWKVRSYMFLLLTLYIYIVSCVSCIWFHVVSCHVISFIHVFHSFTHSVIHSFSQSVIHSEILIHFI